MLDSTKYNLREKVLKCVQEGTNELSRKTDHLEQRLDETSNTLVNKLNDTIFTINEHLAEKEYLSSEYILDSFYALNQNKPRVLICGYYGAQNLGDELMLQSILKILDSQRFDITIMLAANAELDASIYSPYKVLHYPTKSNDILLLSNNYDFIIWGGGAVLDDEYYDFNYLNVPLAYILLKLSIAAIKNGKKVYVLGVSTNKIFNNDVFIKDLSEVIEQSTFFSLRDTNSLKTIRQSGIKTSKIKIIDDLVISDFPKFKPSLSKNLINIGIVYIFNDTDFFALESFTKTVANKFIKDFPDKQIQLTFIPFYNQGNEDYINFQKIVAKIPQNKNLALIIKNFPENIDELTRIYSTCNYIISMRYHATLISSLCKIKTLSINYGDEHRHYFNKIQYIKEHYTPFAEIPSVQISNKIATRSALQEMITLSNYEVNPNVFNSAKQQLVDIIKSIN